MKQYLQRTVNSLGFRIIVPVILVTLFLGLSLYLFVLRSVSHFTETQIQENFLSTAHDIYSICDRNLNDLLMAGAAANETMLRIKKGLTVGQIEDFMRQNEIYGSVIDGEKEVLSSGSLPPGLVDAIEKAGKEGEVRLLPFGGEEYYTYHFGFEPWKWHIVLVHHPIEYSFLLSRLQVAYGVTGLIILVSAILLLYYFNKTVSKPISLIIGNLRQGEKPDYKGIAEFEYLSDGLSESMALREKETGMLNNIYHIAISRRGEEFFREVVMAIERVFGLNSYIGKLTDDGQEVRVAALYVQGTFPDVKYISLKGTPCEGVVEKKHMSVIEKDAYKEFPASELLTSLKADSYVGLAVFDRKRDVVGVVAAFGRQREFTESDIKVFQTIGQMVAVEFEMIEKEETEVRMREELFQSQKLEAVGTLAGGIAHDFNNMLQGILGYASLLKMKIPEDDAIYRPLSVIEASAEKAAELTKQLLGFARKGKYVVQPLDLNVIVDDIYKIISRTFDRSIEIATSMEDDLWIIEGDRGQIEHVILNLCLNAKDAMPAGGRLRIATLNAELQPGEIPYPWAGHGRYAVLRVSDTGIGMDDEVKKRVFEPFFTTKERGKGTGMGLAMVYGVVKNHGGMVVVDSEMGKGSSFTVYLPAVEKAPQKQERDEKRPPRGKGTILVVDDEEFVRRFARETLEGLGYRVLEASNGQEALELYERKGNEVDLIILDLMMPKMNGEETFGRLKAVNPHVRVLIASGYGVGDETKMMIKDAGIRGFIQKPFTVTEIAEITNAALSSA